MGFVNKKIVKFDMNAKKQKGSFKSIKEVKDLFGWDYANWVKLCCFEKINHYDGGVWMFEENIETVRNYSKTRIINERKHLENILNGKDIDVTNLRYACTLIATDMLDNGFCVDEIYKKIIDWANLNKLYIKLPIKQLVFDLSQSRRSLSCADVIYISKKEIDFVYKLFTKKNTRMLAIALIVYFKTHSDINGECEINVRMISQWCGLNYTRMNNIYARTFKDIVSSGMIEDLEEVDKYTNKINKYTRRVKANFRFDNSKDFYVKDDCFSSFYRYLKSKYKPS